MILWTRLDAAQIIWHDTPHRLMWGGRDAGHLVTRWLQSCPRSGYKIVCFCTHGVRCHGRDHGIKLPLKRVPSLITAWHRERASPVTSLIRDPRYNWSASKRWGRLAACGTRVKSGRRQMSYWSAKTMQHSDRVKFIKLPFLLPHW